MALKKIFVLRHVQSEEDVDSIIHNLLPDKDIKVTKIGQKQAKKVAFKLQHILLNPNLRVYISSSNRAIETYQIMVDTCNCKEHHVIIKNCIKNLNWGDITPENRKIRTKERYLVGVLHYKFPRGDDSQKYVEEIYKFIQEITQAHTEDDFPEYILIITHGFALRIIIKVLTKMTDNEFKRLANPPNGFWASIIVAEPNKFVCQTKLPIYKK